MYVLSAGIVFIMCVVRMTCQSSRWVHTRSEFIINNITEIKMTEKIKQNILIQLGMSERPKTIPYDVKQERMFTNKNVTASRSEVNEIIRFSEPPDKFQDEKIIQFRFAHVIHPGRRLRVKSASLLIRVKSKQRRRRKQPRAALTERVERHSRRRGKKRRGTRVSLSVSTVNMNGQPAESIAMMKSRIRKNKWFKVSLNQSMMQKLVDASNGTVLLYVQCRGCRRNTHVVLVQSKRRKKRTLKGPRIKTRRGLKLNKARPFLILHTFLESKQRDRRSVNSQCWSVSEQCCKRQLYVSFADIGWDDWIIFPRGFTTADCFGGCRYRSGRGSTNRNECEPTRGRSLYLVYLERNGDVRRSVLPNFIVTRCGCGSRNRSHLRVTSVADE